MVSKNNKHGKPKKKYKKRRTSFRNNKNNINLRSKSLKRNKGGAVGDKPSDFGLPDNTSLNISTLKSLCDRFQYDVDSTEVNPRTMRTNYILPNAKKWYTNSDDINPTKNNAEFEKARQQRVACYTYYKKAFSFGFFKKAFSSEQKKLADPIYGSYDKLLQEDSSDIQAVKDAKNDFLIACARTDAAKRRVAMVILNYIRSSKSTAVNSINVQYKSYLNQLKRLLTKRKTLASSSEKTIYSKKIASIDKLLKSDDPLNDEFKVKKTKEFVKKLNILKTKKQEEIDNNTFIISSYYNEMIITIGALAVLNTTLQLNNLENTIVQPPQWFDKSFSGITIDESYKNMISTDEQENFERYLFGSNAPSNNTTLVRSLSTTTQPESVSVAPISEGEIDALQDDDNISSVNDFLIDTPDTSGEQGTEMQEIVSTALTNINDNSDEFRIYSTDSDPDSERRLSVVDSTSNVTVPTANKGDIRELDQAVIDAMNRSTPFTRSPRESDSLTSRSTSQSSNDDDTDDDNDELDYLYPGTKATSNLPTDVELSDMGPKKPPQLTVKGKSSTTSEGVTTQHNVQYPTNVLIKKLFLDYVRDEASEVVLDKQEKNWYGKNIMYKSCNTKDANRLLEKITDIPSTKTLLTLDKQSISNNEKPIYTTVQRDNTINVDERLQACGGIMDPLQENVDNRQEGLIMSIPQLSWVWRNVAEKDKKLQDEAVCYYKTFIGFCKINNIDLSSKDQCNIPDDWHPDNNNICKDTVDANIAVQDAMARASQQESDFKQKVDQEQSAAAMYQDNLKDYQDRKSKYDAAINKPPTTDDVYAYINEASTGKNPGPVPGVEAPGPEPVDPNQLDSTSQLLPGEELTEGENLDNTSTSVLVPVDNRVGGKNPIVEATITAMKQFGGASTSVELDVFSKCTANKCKNYYSKCRTKEEFQKYWSDFGGLSDEEISRLGGLEGDQQIGLVVSLPQFDKVYNNKAITSTDKEKACLRCLYMGFINLCKSRGIDLDSELQPDITKDYKPGDIQYNIASKNLGETESNQSGNTDPVIAPVDTSDQDTKDDEDDLGSISDIGDDNDDDDDDGDSDGDDDDGLRTASGPSNTRKKVPRGPKKTVDLPQAKSTTVNPPIQIITDNRKKDKYIWIKIKADPNCLTGVIDNTYDSSEATLNKLINIDEDEAVNFAQAFNPSAPPADSDGFGTNPSNSRSNSDGSGIGPSAPPLDDSESTPSVSKPSTGSTSNEPASNLINPNDNKDIITSGGCDNVPEETELRSNPPPGKAKKGELFCPSQAPYLCGKKTISYQDRLKRGLGAACRVKEHDCNSRNLPVGDTDSAKRVYQSVNEEDGLSARFYVDPLKNPGDITSCSKKTKGGSKKNKKKHKKKKGKKLSLKIKN